MNIYNARFLFGEIKVSHCTFKQLYAMIFMVIVCIIIFMEKL